MTKTISKIIGKYIESPMLANYISKFGVLFVIIIASIIVNIITKKVLLKIIERYVRRTENNWDDIIFDSGVMDIVSKIIPVLVLYRGAGEFPSHQEWMRRIIFIVIIYIIANTINKLIDAIELIYRQFEVSKTKPIKGYLQVIQIVIVVVSFITVVSIIIDKSPWILLSGLGAATAVLMLIFQNSILGLVASIQLTSNDMIRIGDWIEMSKYGADGDVIDMSLHTVKVQNWDKTIVTIPTHSLIVDSFKNWRGMQKAGGRRIMRSLYIDISSIKFCDDEMLERFKEIEYIKDYIKQKEDEINRFNNERNINTNSVVNGRKLTNIGTFRAYVERYISNHPGTNNEMLQIVRQLHPTEKGLPIEIYTFTNTVDFVKYEKIQGDIFDHILAIVPAFDLRLYQAPSGYDLQSIKDNL